MWFCRKNKAPKVEPPPSPNISQVKLYSGATLIHVGRCEQNQYSYESTGYISYTDIDSGEQVVGRGNYLIEDVDRNSPGAVANPVKLQAAEKIAQVKLYSGGKLIHVGRCEPNHYSYETTGYISYTDFPSGDAVTGRGDYLVEIVNLRSPRPTVGEKSE